VKAKASGRRTTSQDVATLAGVSVTTVSFVINNRSGGNVRISEETRQKVWEAVEALNYRPMSAAQALRTKRSNLLALVIPHIDSAFQPQFAAAIQREAETENLDVIIYGTRDELARERAFLDVLISRSVDGVIIHSHNSTGEAIDRLVEAGIAVVIHGNSPVHSSADNVMIDEVRAAEDVIDYLIGRGHRRIGLISGPEVTWDGHLRKEGYKNALRTHGIGIEAELIHETEFFTPHPSRTAMQKLFALPEPPTAIFTASDLLAIDALLYAVDSGFAVPDDVAIVGFDNIREATMVRPRLTTVHKDVNLLAATAVEMLVERINSKNALPSRQIILEHEIVARESA
jgi:LacI family transcriptional regulator